jgi:hypothetical protein
VDRRWRWILNYLSAPLPGPTTHSLHSSPLLDPTFQLCHPVWHQRNIIFGRTGHYSQLPLLPS